VRDHNEDGCANRPDIGLFVVADGAGGHHNGQMASGMVVEALGGIAAGLSPGEAVREVRERLARVHADLRARAAAIGGGAIIATTVVVLLTSKTHYACLWVGDSRIYLERDGALARLTRDHSLVQELVDAGLLAEVDAESHPRANVITRAIGAEESTPEIDMVTDVLKPGDRFLLCSDGLTKSTPEDAIAALLNADDDSPAERLVMAALARNATDNVTAVTVEVLDEDSLDTLGQG
jgi:protein phosphatase/serine/threonine-protein phosphatase Stp1